MDKFPQDEAFDADDFDLIINTAPIVYWKINANGYFTLSKGVALKNVGLEENEVVGQSVYDLYKDFPDIIKSIDSALKGVSLSVVLSGPSNRWFETNFRPIFSGSRQIRGVVGVSIDVTEQRKLFRDLSSAKKDAERANRTKSQFLANMSHEIRTPLSGVIGFSDVLMHETKSKGTIQSQEMRPWIERIFENSNHLLKLVDGILDLAKVEAGRMDLEEIDFSLSEFLEEIDNLVGESAKAKGLDFNIRTIGQLPYKIRTDRTKLKQVLLNVIGNSTKFTEEGFVKVLVVVDSDTNPKELKFVVSDSGPGIHPKDQSNVFEIFNQLDQKMRRRFGGAGLGLALSQKLARLLGGDLKLSQAGYGVGSEFTISIQLKPLKTQRSRVDGRYNFRSVQCGKKILIVDDSADVQMILTKFLESTDAIVDHCFNGAEALKKASANKYDLILMDIQMPVMDGYEAIKELRAHGCQTKVFALTAHAMSGEKEKCLAAGFDDHIAKPVSRSDIYRKLSEFESDSLKVDVRFKNT